MGDAALIVSAALSPCVDRTVVVDRLRVGEVHRLTHAVVTPGGKGFNVARAATVLGNQVAAIGIVGGHAGRWLEEQLRDAGVQTHLVPGGRETRTSTSVADASTGVMTDFYEPPTPVTGAEWRSFEERVSDVCAGRRGSWLSISGTLATGAPRDAVSRMVSLGRSLGMRVAVDSHGPCLVDAMTASPDVVKVNEAEARQLLGARGTDLDAHALAGSLQQRLLEASVSRFVEPLAIVTAGVNGAFTTTHHVSCPETGMYPVGSGDSFLAGLLVAFDRGEDLMGALCLATGAAAANALMPGAAVFSQEQALDLANLTQVALNPSARS